NSTNSAADHLAEGESHTETFTATVTDDFGATASQVVSITVTGTNDSPVITTAAGQNAGSVREAGNFDNGSSDAGTASVGGTLSSSDVDTGATAAWSGSAAGSYGAFAINAIPSSTLLLSNSTNSAADHLAEGESHTETF